MTTHVDPMLQAAVERQVRAAQVESGSRTTSARRAADAVPSLIGTLGLAGFQRALVDDDKPRVVLLFDRCAVAGFTGSVVLKVYGDQPRAEGALQQLWRRHGVPTPATSWGELGGCTWVLLEYLPLTSLTPASAADCQTLTEELAQFGELMHARLDDTAPAGVSRAATLLRPLDLVMVPRLDRCVAALRSAGYEVPDRWWASAASAYRWPSSSPLHGDLALSNVARSSNGELIIYDTSGLAGAPAFDAIRWAARLSSEQQTAAAVYGWWRRVEALPDTESVADLLGAECLMEAGSRQIVRSRKERAGIENESDEVHVARLLNLVRELLD